MGMGEPLMNTRTSCCIIDTSPNGLGVTQTNYGINIWNLKIIRLISDLKPKFKLAISLHSAIEDTKID